MADYRGYGASGGSPGFTHLIHDGHLFFKAVREELSRKGLEESLWVMGRSMGSLSAVDLAYHYPEQMKGVIVESGFASVTRLIKHLNLPARGLNLDPIEQERLAMIRQITVPALIIHGELDMLVPVQEAKDLYHLLEFLEEEAGHHSQRRSQHHHVVGTDLEVFFEHEAVEISGWRLRNTSPESDPGPGQARTS